MSYEYINQTWAQPQAAAGSTPTNNTWIYRQSQQEQSTVTNLNVICQQQQRQLAVNVCHQIVPSLMTTATATQMARMPPIAQNIYRPTETSQYMLPSAQMAQTVNEVGQQSQQTARNDYMAMVPVSRQLNHPIPVESWRVDRGAHIRTFAEYASPSET